MAKTKAKGGRGGKGGSITKMGTVRGNSSNS